MRTLGKILEVTTLVLLAGCGGYAVAQGAASLDDKKAKFYEMEAKAPPGYPTLFVVTNAYELPNASAQCNMEIETLGASYSIEARDGSSSCKTYAPNSVLFGYVHNTLLLGQVVDIVDPRDMPKPKHHQYQVDSRTILDTAVQLKNY